MTDDLPWHKRPYPSRDEFDPNVEAPIAAAWAHEQRMREATTSDALDPNECEMTEQSKRPEEGHAD